MVEEKLKVIQEKLQQLLRQNLLLEKENLRLTEQLSQAEAELSERQSAIVRLQQQADVLKYSTVSMNEEEKKAFEKKINTYIKEIDRCISLLKH